ncbi:acyltransferase family protein [Gemmata sp.]|uniref:acyltransferase family protein n=1 Tax=Gemmata sp. TaxID=1914242 RepID=UPI003F713A51
MDALRGVACLWVVLVHTQHTFGLATVPEAIGPRVWASFALTGYLGVNLFLVLSGFCLAYPVTKREWRLGLREFAVRRWWRIYPPYVAALAVCYLVALRFGPDRAFLSPLRGWGDLLAHLTMTHNLVPEYATTGGVVFWTLALECQLYAAFALAIVPAVRVAGVWWVAAAALGCSLLWTAWCVGSDQPFDQGYGFTLWVIVAPVALARLPPGTPPALVAVPISVAAAWVFFQVAERPLLRPRHAP